MFFEGTTCNIVGKKLDEAKKAIKMSKNEKVLRFDKAEDYYNSLRSNSLENCQDICMKDVNCEMSSFLVFFKFCYLYNNTEFRQHNTDYGYSNSKINLNRTMMSLDVDNFSSVNRIKKLFVFSTLFICCKQYIGL